jgi:hypothetical protein
VCGRPLPRNIAAVQSIGAGWITDAFAGSHTGVYGGPGEQIPVGDATVVVLGHAQAAMAVARLTG